ncbi:MAG TPA: hypothetical protein VK484_12740 [Ferruginibacter sp.]|nr:hypothetical protein [Ferruginibacter sp.]
MKRLFTLTATLLFAVFFLSSCVKDRDYVNEENYWLSQEIGEVVYSSPSCNYWVVETYNGYNIVYSGSSSKPYEGQIIYGNFSRRGQRELYNFSESFVFTATVTDTWLTYGEALDLLDHYCPYGKSGEPRVLKQSTKIRKK